MKYMVFYVKNEMANLSWKINFVCGHEVDDKDAQEEDPPRAWRKGF